jgi:predicted esterase
MNVSMDYIEELIRIEVSDGVPISRIVLMGYSQGAALLSLFILTRKIAANIGIMISCSGIPPAPMQSIARMQRENGLAGRWSKETSYFMLHGQDDVFMPLAVFHEWRRRLKGCKERGQGIANLEWELLEMRHSISERLWPSIRRILENRIALAEVKLSGKL